ncbi:MAG: MarR family winged helix-turn-helix transcriptional regulator, partial [Propionicimonas sp.]
AEDRNAWIAFRHVAVDVVAQLDADLHRQAGIGFTDFDALIQLSLAPAGTLRMADLARAVSRTPSTLTRLVARLEACGVMSRVRHSATEVAVSITGKGYAMIEELAPRHLELIDELFWSPLTDAQTSQMEHLCRKLIRASDGPCVVEPG